MVGALRGGEQIDGSNVGAVTNQKPLILLENTKKPALLSQTDSGRRQACHSLVDILFKSRECFISNQTQGDPHATPR